MRTDSSPILIAGQAQAQANQAFGNAVGGVVEKFYQKKKDKQERDEREQAYLKMGLTSEEAKAASRDKDLANQFINKMNADRNFNLQMLQFKDNEALNAARIASLADDSIGRIADREMAEENKQKQIGMSEALLAETTDPEVLEDFNEAQPGLFALGGNQGVRNRFLEFQRDEAPTVLGGELDSSNFARYAREQNLDPVLAGNYFMNLQKAEQAVAKENTGKIGDQFASRLPALEPYYFSESDATNAVSREATKLNINLNKDQLAQAVSKQKIIPTKDLRSAADTRFSKLNLDEPRTILEAADDLESFLDEGGVLSGKVAKEKLARMVQPAGILTEDDLRRMGTSSAFMDSLNTLLEEKKTGKIDKTLEGYLRNTTKVFRQRAQQVLREKTDWTVKSLADNFGITPEEVRKYTQFGGIMYGFDQPSNQSPQQGQPPQNPSVQSPSTLKSGGIFTPIAP